MGDAVLDHLRHNLLDPRGPVAHAQIEAVALRIQFLLDGRDLLPGDAKQGRTAADHAVVVGDLLQHGRRRRSPAADVRQIAGQFVERIGASIGHDEHAQRETNLRHVAAFPEWVAVSG